MKTRQTLSNIALGLIAGVLVSSANVQAATTPTPSGLPKVTLLATDPYALAGTSSGAFTLIRDAVGNADLAVSLGISGTASNGVDYATITNVVTIPAGYLAVDILIQPKLDLAKRGNKTVVLTVQTNADYVPVRPFKSAVVGIVDDTYNIVPPTVTLTTPTNGSVFKAGSTITLTADAGDVDVPILSVAFRYGNTTIATVTNSPYTTNWANVSAGSYLLYALAVDAAGQSTLSAPVSVLVTNEIPVIKVTSPTNGENFVVQSPIPLKAEFSADTVIARFLANGRVVASFTNSPSPVSYSWTTASSGYYVIQGEAIDAAGTKGYSKQVSINVSKR